jgi:hypothetical protein
VRVLTRSHACSLRLVLAHAMTHAVDLKGMWSSSDGPCLCPLPGTRCLSISWPRCWLTRRRCTPRWAYSEDPYNNPDPNLNPNPDPKPNFCLGGIMAGWSEQRPTAMLSSPTRPACSMLTCAPWAWSLCSSALTRRRGPSSSRSTPRATSWGTRWVRAYGGACGMEGGREGGR